MLFKSAYSDLQVLVRSESVMYHPATGVEVGRTRALTANFGSHGGTFLAPDPLTGEMGEHVQVFGHYFDSEAAAETHGWTDDERESVDQALLRLAVQQPYLLAPVVMEHVPASRPWPTYDSMNARDIVAYAKVGGMLGEALIYERENKARSTLISELEELIAAQAVPEPEVAGITL